MDLSAGGLAPASRDGGARAGRSDPLDALLSPLASPTSLAPSIVEGASVHGSPPRPARHRTDATPEAFQGLEDASLAARAKGARASEPGSNVGGLAPGSLVPPSILKTTYTKKFRPALPSRYFEVPLATGKGDERDKSHTSGVRPALCAGKLALGQTAGRRSPDAHEGPLSSTPMLKFFGGSPPPPRPDDTPGPSQTKTDSVKDTNAVSGEKEARYTPTDLRKLVELDRFVSEEGHAEEQAQLDREDRVETRSVYSIAETVSRYEATDDGRSVLGGFKRTLSEMREVDEDDYDETERDRHRRSGTPFTASEYPDDETASCFSSRRHGRRRARSLAFSVRSLYSERSRDGDASPEPAGQDSGFYGIEGERKLEAEKDQPAGAPAAAQDNAASPDDRAPYVGLDPLTPIPALYADNPRPYLAHTAALAEAAFEAEEAAAKETRAEEQDQDQDQENIAPSPTLKVRQPLDAQEPAGKGFDANMEVIKRWSALRGDAAQRFGNLLSQVDGLLEGKVARYEQLRLTLQGHATTLDERSEQLEETKRRLRGWGEQLFAGCPDEAERAAVDGGEDQGVEGSGGLESENIEAAAGEQREEQQDPSDALLGDEVTTAGEAEADSALKPAAGLQEQEQQEQLGAADQRGQQHSA